METGADPPVSTTPIALLKDRASSMETGAGLFMLFPDFLAGTLVMVTTAGISLSSSTSTSSSI